MARAPHLDISIQDHARIVEYLEYVEQRDGEKTAKAFERLILQGRQRMLDVIPASLRDQTFRRLHPRRSSRRARDIEKIICLQNL
jgi:hypothetical protein